MPPSIRHRTSGIGPGAELPATLKGIVSMTTTLSTTLHVPNRQHPSVQAVAIDALYTAMLDTVDRVAVEAGVCSTTAVLLPVSLAAACADLCASLCIPAPDTIREAIE